MQYFRSKGAKRLLISFVYIFIYNGEIKTTFWKKVGPKINNRWKKRLDQKLTTDGKKVQAKQVGPKINNRWKKKFKRSRLDQKLTTDGKKSSSEAGWAKKQPFVSEAGWDKN
jgi:hypothetical protein